MIAAWKYVDETYDADTREKIVRQLSPSVRDALGTYKEVEFYPANHWGEILHGIATVVGKTEEKAQQELQACGSFIALQATNTFLRLLMRVLTPTLFARKIPTLWSRDNTAGSFNVDLTNLDDGRLVFNLSDVSGYMHCGPCSMGWVSFAMKQMGRPTKSIKLSGWSLDNPAPKECSIDLQLAQS